MGKREKGADFAVRDKNLALGEAVAGVSRDEGGSERCEVNKGLVVNIVELTAREDAVDGFIEVFVEMVDFH